MWTHLGSNRLYYNPCMKGGYRLIENVNDSYLHLGLIHLALYVVIVADQS